MSLVIEVYAYLKLHGLTIAGILLTIISVAEAIVRLTPTKKDDGAVERIGGWIRKALDMLGKIFPNLKKGGGKHPDKKEVEKKDV